MIGLFGKTVPKTTKNFKALAEGTTVGLVTFSGESCIVVRCLLLLALIDTFL